MKRLLRKALFLAIPGALALVGWTGLRPQSAYAEQFCLSNGRRCFTEGQQFSCIYMGCCGYVGYGTCECVDGYWSCPVPPECPPPEEYCP
jgi:hypothetical protein